MTVAPTHRRRGIARALLEGELRTAASVGAPMAMLTVSESQLYGRYGFGAAASSAYLRLDTRRAGWRGPETDGRVDFIPRERWRELVPALHDRIRTGVPGEIDVPPSLWNRYAGTTPAAKDAEALRAVQYADASGELQGLALYRVIVDEEDFARSRVDLVRLDAATGDAYAALWRFVVELDLIAEVRAGELSADEPMLWMIDDRRAAKLEVQDHQYVRILDVPAVLGARRYPTAGSLRLDVVDPLGFAGGTFTLEVGDDGVGRVTEGDGGATDAVSLGIRELSTVSLGGVSLATLVRAGRATATDPVRAAALLSWPVVPALSLWY